jgi:putative membrane protein
MTTGIVKSANELAVERTDLAVRRNVMACDRTLMAWVRTALSMISFGFTLYKILEGFQQAGAKLPSENSPRNIGLFLIALGTASMAMGIVEYLQAMKDLRRYERVGWMRASLVIALVMSASGALLLLGIATRLL